ncbi:hypothetical protein PF005_g1657 [Phytophthora fragariae]|uniref:Uncharacterized protein n=1 Tax=Phytophthora fragariae TaxID=53985 RepID=A0A6A3USP6_9STRA|nr:hypothetical protein PF003_g35116 [Phytophthora fragariae]KAE8948710.1 hypothetical protein PF009_g1712 [Phytophthora fragariae]KAE9021743.1 hypothetical protein PF011_g4799 [Phytophthora fragariae]KAE9128951.1 hypothetical protein PF007_g5089 [Phytophthora fragariae]KAE9138336.1 hypothetical protein PF010_g991 [Phytophthora fragariae]
MYLTELATRALALLNPFRDLAAQRLKRRNPPGEDDSQSPNKFAKLAEVLREHEEKDLKLRREQWEQERQYVLPPRLSAARTSNAFCKW